MLEYLHVDVFTSKVLSGNGLTVVFDNNQTLTTEQMQLITQEFKQFETIFITKIALREFTARIFTVDEELQFAGHPILGATACIHNKYFSKELAINIQLNLSAKTVLTNSEKKTGHYYVEMDQGTPEIVGIVPKKEYLKIITRLNLLEDDLDKELPLEVVSTGLPYLIIPITKGLEKVEVLAKDLEETLKKYKAKFTYVVDIPTLECRSWDNTGKGEDVATGSAAGPLCAYLVTHGVTKPDTSIQIKQGKYVGRPSVIETRYDTGPPTKIKIAGDVTIFASGTINT